MLWTIVFVEIWLAFSSSWAQEDLEIVGSEHNFAFEPKSKDGAGDAAGYYSPEENFAKIEFTEPEDVPNFPVKTVQRFKDADGNVKIVTSYSNRDDSPLPIYKDSILRQQGLEKAHSQKPKPEPKSDPKPKLEPKVASTFITTAIPAFAQIDRRQRPTQEFAQMEHRQRPIKQEYSATKTVKLPNDGQLYADQHETTSSDGKSSSYNQKSSYKKNYKKPPVKSVQSDTNDKKDKVIVNQPLEEAGSSYVSDIDEGGVDGPSSDVGGEGYAGGSSSYSSGSFSDYDRGDGGYRGGPEVYEAVDEGGHDDGHHQHHGDHHHGHDHGQSFKKGQGSSYEHGNKAAKGDKGGKGFAKNEHYEKGHAESHGHEAEKGGQKEETGGKTGHLDEGNHYAKGHSEGHGSEGKEKGHSKGHKKGHKTKGFRTVHHKDEYKKDEVFYDDEHDAGYQKGHGQHHEAHKHSKGGANKKGHLNSGYKHAQKGFQGDKKKGHSYKNAKGHSGSSGNSHHKGHQEHFDKAAGHKGGEAHGHEHYHKGH